MGQHKVRQLLGFLAARKKLSIFIAVLGGGLGLIPIMALGGNQLIQVVDSSAFCISCHSVHDAEAITYRLSPHSKIACSTCHVGSGTQNLVMSKLNGLKDILPTFTGNYEHPISTPLKDRRPSSQTCETCHWSEKFFGDVPRIKTTYGTDQANSENTTTLVLKVDGGKMEVASGIHWHATAKVWYLPLDDQRREIAWVGTESASGNVTEYVDPSRIGEITPELIQSKKRLMDCVDCHNRVTHLFRSPNDLIDAALSDGSIDVKLPFIKQQGISALVPQNKSLAEAFTKIAAISDFYQNSDPEIFQNKASEIAKSIAKLKEIARLTIFEDGLDWKTHADNSVHDKPDSNMLIDWEPLSTIDQSSGCFRCHGNLLKVENSGQLSLDQALNEHNVSQFTERVNLTLDSLKNVPPPFVTTANITAYLASITISTDNQTVVLPGDNRTSVITSDNLTALIPTGAYPVGKGLQADCNSCHYTLKSKLISPLAPATSHPIDGLDECLVCHNPTSAKPFKTTHPWTTNEACNSCHQSAPKLKPLPSTGPPEEAKQIPHDLKGLEACLVCHGTKATNPIKEKHPWSTDDTCTACHQTASQLKPIPLSTPPVAPDISHPAKGLEDCLSCHGQPTVIPFTTNHPWSTDKNCSLCHKQATTFASFSDQPRYVMGPKIKHAIAGLADCTSCHRGTSEGHPWTNVQICTKCHQVSSAGGAAGGGGGVSAPPSTPTPGPPQAVSIKHSITGLDNCTSCHNIAGAMLFPSDHVGRPNSMCLLCHQPAPPATISASPSALAAVAVSAGQVNLTWLDNATDETGYRIDRATTSDFLTNLLTVNTAANAVSYSDTTVSGSTTYYYRVYATNSVGISVASNTASVMTPASTVPAPAAPTSLTASTISAWVNLAWLDNATNETGYRIDRATTSNFTTNLVTVNTVIDAVSYSDTTVSGNITYYYRVYAFNSAGNSAASNTASVTTPVVVIDASSLYTSNCAICHGANRQGGSASALTTSALSGVTLAQVTSTITNGIGTMPAYSSSLTSAQISALAQWLKGPPPAAPTSLSASAINAGQVNLFWLDNSTDEAGFRIERATTNDFLTNLSTATVAANAVTYSDTTAVGSTTYYYRVFAYNASGDSAASNTASATTPAPTVTAPAAPTSLAATAISAGQVNLTWLDNATNETGYRIDRATTSNFLTNLITTTVTANVTSYNDTTTAGSTTYYYRLYAFNSAGNSGASNIATVTTPVAPIDPAALYSANCAVCHGANRQGGSASALTSSALSAVTLAQVTSTITNGTAGMPAYSSSLTSAQIAVLAQWLKGSPPTAPTNLAATAPSAGQVNLNWVDNANDETGFRIERATNSSFSVNLVTANTAANVISYSDTTVSGSTTYYYRVHATNSAGDCVNYDLTSVTTPAPTVAAPAAPTGLAAIAISAGQVNLNWVDNATNETGYRIDRATNNTFTTNLITVNTAANAINYSDNTVSASTTYYYRLYAFNSAGNSGASNIATVTTPAPVPAQFYSANCAVCHGTNGQGSSAPAVAGAAAPTTRFVVRGGGTTMPPFTTSQISNTDLTNLSTYVTGLGPVPTTGAAMYSLDCAVCHGATGQGTALAPYVAGVPASTLSSITRSGLGTIMPAYSTTDISAANLTTLANYIAAMGPPPSDGWGVYAEYCAVCHGTSGEGGSGGRIAGTSVSTTTSVVRNGTGSMPAFTTTQISNTGLTNLANYVYNLIPARPTGLTATAVSASQVNLTWTNNAITGTITGMRLQRATDSSFSNNRVTFNLGVVTSYSDTTVSGSTTYYYRVYATNLSGSSSASSTASVTTPAN
ncbi:MAG: c-type cytochrome [Chloroflexi bacterium]|nr:c-type cytochrome [Chloroflexota bacterium]